MSEIKYIVITGSEQLLQLMKRVSRPDRNCSYGYSVKDGKAIYFKDRVRMAVNKYPAIFRVKYSYENIDVDHMPFPSIGSEYLDWVTKAMSIEKFIEREKKWKKKWSKEEY